jgi:HD-GYP domain-containing protein (c-di-GMP phosphodiesterase class II)
MTQIPDRVNRSRIANRDCLDVRLTAVMDTFGQALQRGDGCTYAHSSRLIHYAMAVGAVMGLTEDPLLALHYGVFLHDIGKLKIQEAILRKPGPLSASEWSAMRRHPGLGFRMAVDAGLPDDVAAVILAHHEWYDGSGYPQGLQGADIPLAARICSAVDTLDALTSERPYRQPVSVEEALAEIRKGRETHFDPLVTDACLTIPVAAWTRLRSLGEARRP